MRRLLVGVLALSFVGCGGESGKEGPGSGKVDEKSSALADLQKELRYAPKNTTAILSVSVADLLKSKFVAGLSAREKKEIIEDMAQDLGIPLANVSRATLLATEEGSLWVVRTRTDLDARQVLDQRLKGERIRAAQSTFAFVGNGGGKSPAPVKDDRERWKSTALGQYRLYEKDIVLLGRPFRHEAFCIPEPRVCLSYSAVGKDAGQSLLRRVLGAKQDAALSGSLRAAVGSFRDLKTVQLAVCVRDNHKLQTRAQANAKGDIQKIVGGVDWAMLEAEINAESVFLSRARLACAGGASPAALRKRIESTIATVLEETPGGGQGADARDSLLARLFLKELQRSLRWQEEGQSIVADFRVDARELYLLICSLGTSAENTFQKVGTKVKSSPDGRK